MKTYIPLSILVLFALVGLVDSSIIHLKEIASATDTNAFASCSVSALLDCGAVARSKYSHLLGIPVSQIGIYFYTAASVIGIAFLTNWRPPRWVMAGITAVAVLSFLFSWYLLFMSYFGIGALCIYCLVSNLSTTVVTIAWFTYMWMIKPQPTQTFHA